VGRHRPGLERQRRDRSGAPQTTRAFDGITHASPDRTSSPRWFTHTV